MRVSSPLSFPDFSTGMSPSRTISFASLDLSGFTFYLALRSTLDAEDNDLQVAFPVASGSSVTLALTKKQTADLLGKYYYEISCVDAAGNLSVLSDPETTLTVSKTLLILDT